MSQVMRDALADLLATLPPGPELGLALAEVPALMSLTSTEKALVLTALDRQVAFAQAELLSGALELARTPWQCGDDPAARLPELDEFSADQVAFTLTWSHGYAEDQVELAKDLIVRLPMVFEALRLGRLDLARARLFSRQLAGLADEVARKIVVLLLEKATTWDYTTLRKRLHYWVHKADAGLAKRRYEQGVTQRSVHFSPADNGTATLSGTNLPVARSLMADDNLDRLAAAAKALGDPRSMTQLRADISLDLLSSRPFEITPSLDPLTELADEDARAERRAARHANRRANDRQDRSDGDDSGDDSGGDGGGSREGGGDVGRDPFGRLLDESVIGLRWSEQTNAAYLEALRRTCNPTLNIPRGGGELVPDEWCDTWLDPGGGESFPHHLFTRYADADLHLPTAVTPPDTTGENHPPTNGRETGTGSGGSLTTTENSGAATSTCTAATCTRRVQVSPRRGVADIVIGVETLMCLNDDPGIVPGWGDVIADVARQIALDPDNLVRWRFNLIDNNGQLLAQATTRRRPSAADSDFIEARDQTCRAPGCHRKAMRCDKDHRIEHAKGGPANRTNLCSLCKLCRRRHNLHYADFRIMPRSVLKACWRKGSVVECAA